MFSVPAVPVLDILHGDQDRYPASTRGAERYVNLPHADLDKHNVISYPGRTLLSLDFRKGVKP